MAEPADNVFVVTVEAVAGPGVDPPDGRRYTILAFACAADEAAAALVARADLAAGGWMDIEVLRTGEIVRPEAVPDDLRNALETARRFGCALVIYDEP